MIGVVTDPTGSVIPKAKVTVTNVETGISRDTVTDADGAYQILWSRSAPTLCRSGPWVSATPSPVRKGSRSTNDQAVAAVVFELRAHAAIGQHAATQR